MRAADQPRREVLRRRPGASAGIHLVRPAADGMSIGKLIASPELRANLDAGWRASLRPECATRTIKALASTVHHADDAERSDRRSPAQRQHDALNALVRGQLGDPKLGVHNGLPVTVIVSTTLQELTSGTGRAVTGGGTLLPMRDVIRMARHAYHYLAVFDNIKAALCIWAGPADCLTGSAYSPLREGPRLHAPGLRRARLLVRGPSSRRVGSRRLDRHRQLHLRLRARSQADRKGLAGKKRPDGRTEWIPTPHSARPRRAHQRLPPPGAPVRRRCGALTAPVARRQLGSYADLDMARRV